MPYCSPILIFKMLIQRIPSNKRFPSFMVSVIFPNFFGLHP